MLLQKRGVWLDGTRLVYPLLYDVFNLLGNRTSMYIKRYYLEKYSYYGGGIREKRYIYTGWKSLGLQYLSEDLICFVLMIILSSLRAFAITPIDCDKQLIKLYQCERNTYNNTDLEISQNVSFACEPGQRKCDNGECLLDIYFCDGHIDCSDNSDEQYECQTLVTSLACENNVYILFMCNQITNCTDILHDCIYHYKDLYIQNNSKILNTMYSCKTNTGDKSSLIPTLFVNDLVIDCPYADDEPRLFNYRHNVSHYCSAIQKIPCVFGDNICYSKEKTCLYDLNDYGRLMICSNGAHLIDCQLHNCMDTFKCSNSYCISWRKSRLHGWF